MTDKPYAIVCAVDYSQAGDLALERAFELTSERPLARLHVVNVLPVYQPGTATDAAWSGALPSVAQAAEELRGYVERKKAEYRAAHAGQNLQFLDTVLAHQRVEAPAEEIAQLAADLEADLVVVGTHGRRGLSRLVLGSVAEATVRLAPCPVLVVRPKAVPAPVPAIQPPCPVCVETRKATGGKEMWCEQHREHHGQRHTYHQGDRGGADTNMPLVVHS